MIKKYKEILSIILGSIIVSFSICNIHSKIQITEGGQLGIELLLFNLFNISPAISSFIIDCIGYLLGFIFLNKKFRINAIIGTTTYSVSYFAFEKINIPTFLPNNLLLISIIAGLFVGFGCGLVVKNIGVCGGDDSLALVINKKTKIPLMFCYFGMDLIIILLSLFYISSNLIFYSILTSFISSFIIDLSTRKKLENCI